MQLPRTPNVWMIIFDTDTGQLVAPPGVCSYFSSMSSRGEADHTGNLVERVRNSDQEAFRLLFEKYQPVLFRSLRYLLDDADTVHDIVQATFLRVWEHRSSLKPDLPILAYLLRVGRNLIRDHARHQAVRGKYAPDVGDALYGQQADPQEILQHTLLEEKLAEILKTRVPHRCREVFLLSRIEGMSNAEIGRQLGISEKTVENQITRALRILRKLLRG